MIGTIRTSRSVAGDVDGETFDDGRCVKRMFLTDETHGYGHFRDSEPTVLHETGRYTGLARPASAGESESSFGVCERFVERPQDSPNFEVAGMLGRGLDRPRQPSRLRARRYAPRPATTSLTRRKIAWRRRVLSPVWKIIGGRPADGLRAAALLLLALVGVSAPAQAALYNKPVYDPASKSYYELVDASDFRSRFEDGVLTWPEAAAEARKRSFNGVQGQLALVDSGAVHFFLLETFRPDRETWIGYRYLCKERELQDSTGRAIGAKSFSAWDRRWRQDPFICNVNQYTHDFLPGDFMPVAYSPISKGFRWIGKGRAKGYAAYFVQYPTGTR